MTYSTESVNGDLLVCRQEIAARAEVPAVRRGWRRLHHPGRGVQHSSESTVQLSAVTGHPSAQELRP